MASVLGLVKHFRSPKYVRRTFPCGKFTEFGRKSVILHKEFSKANTNLPKNAGVKGFALTKR